MSLRSRHTSFVGFSKAIRCLLIFPSHFSELSLDVVMEFMVDGVSVVDEPTGSVAVDIAVVEI